MSIKDWDFTIFIRPKAKLARIAKRDGWTCHYCGRPVTPWKHAVTMDGGPNPFRDFATLDHKVPRANGGDNSDNNLVIACLICNTEKSSRWTYENFVAHKRGGK